jgi:hypothetical protein
MRCRVIYEAIVVTDVVTDHIELCDDLRLGGTLVGTRWKMTRVLLEVGAVVTCAVEPPVNPQLQQKCS